MYSTLVNPILLQNIYADVGYTREDKVSFLKVTLERKVYKLTCHSSFISIQSLK